EQLSQEGIKFRTGVAVGIDIDATELRNKYDAIVLAVGATSWRDLPIEGRQLNGIYQAMEYLPPANKVALGELAVSPIEAKDKNVVIIGGGDTGADCLGTAHRQGAKSVTQLEILPM
ncbi:MAG: FAD-dependent oxidoreductase, partial [Candidatus Fonsibacter sp.]